MALEVQAAQTPQSLNDSTLQKLTKEEALERRMKNLEEIRRLQLENKKLLTHAAELKMKERRRSSTSNGPRPTHKHPYHHLNREHSEPHLPEPEVVEREMSKQLYAERTRHIIRLENALHSLKLKFHPSRYDKMANEEIDIEATKAECISEVHEALVAAISIRPKEEEPLLKIWAKVEPQLTLKSEVMDLQEISEKARTLFALWCIEESGEVKDLTEHIQDFTFETNINSLREAVVKAHMLSDTRGHLEHLKLTDEEKAYSMSTDLKLIEKMYEDTKSDRALLSKLKTCALCKEPFAPEKVLKQHPHLNLKKEGTTMVLGLHNCCSTCAKYWD